MSNKSSVEELVSAGGVVFRNDGAGPEVVLCGKRMPRQLWALPKGTPERGETREQTALREVTEETGLQVRTQCFIDSIQYWFVRSNDGVRCHKTVLYYLMDSTGGDTSLHDNEFDEVRWFSVEDALKTMSYGNEAEVVKKGLSMALRA
ncbi:MAG: NUDIX hydrolase [Dehalococcoidia bacterium]|nr:NUDIX hydrolase [Dehalococcoidia bacterium]